MICAKISDKAQWNEKDDKCIVKKLNRFKSKISTQNENREN